MTNKLEAEVPESRVVDVGEDGDAETRSGRRQHLDQLPPALEVLAQHQRGGLANHRTPEAE